MTFLPHWRWLCFELPYLGLRPWHCSITKLEGADSTMPTCFKPQIGTYSRSTRTSTSRLPSQYCLGPTLVNFRVRIGTSFSYIARPCNTKIFTMFYFHKVKYFCIVKTTFFCAQLTSQWSSPAEVSSSNPAETTNDPDLSDDDSNDNKDDDNTNNDDDSNDNKVADYEDDYGKGFISAGIINEDGYEKRFITVGVFKDDDEEYADTVVFPSQRTDF